MCKEIKSRAMQMPPFFNATTSIKPSRWIHRVPALGTTKRRDLIGVVGPLGARRDPRAPTKSDGQCKDSENPKSRDLLGPKEILYNELRQRYGALAKAAQQHPLKYQRYKELSNSIAAERRKQQRNDGALRVDHFATVYIKGTKKQLSGSPGSTFC